ncbi:MAG: gliding motility-associated C-terminal domain-containing protein, partial [Flavobacteriaceae bacterium]
KTYGDPDFNLSATSSSTGAFSFSISDTDIATLTGSNTTIQGAGTTSVTVSQAADSNYNAATVTRTLTVNKANPILTFNDITKTYGDPDFNLSATSSSTGEFSYDILDNSIATINGSWVTLESPGTTIIMANQLADINYTLGTVSITLTVLLDSDQDGIPNLIDLDDDNDGILDILESNLDYDNDGQINSIDSDSDGDGCPDAVEAGFTDGDFDGYIGISPVQVDRNGLVEYKDGYQTPLDFNQNSVYDFLEEIIEVDFSQFNLPESMGFDLNESITLEIGGIYNPELKYQWQVSTDQGFTYQTIENESESPNKLILAPKQIDDGNLYRVIIEKIGYACESQFISNSIKIYYNELFVPNAISPNSDGVNDYWRIVGLEAFKNSHVVIYNRLGIKVFESKDYRNDWNGSFNGDPIPDGTYFYEIHLSNNEIKKGFIYVKKN